MKKLLSAGLLGLAVICSPVQSQEWTPDGSIELMIQFPPGGGGDILARAVANYLERSKGWNVVVENRPGGGGVALAKALKSEKPDGQTIGMGVSEIFAFAPVMNPNVGFETSDFQFLGSIANTQIGWVVPGDAPWNSFQELVDAAQTEEIEVGVFSPRSNAAVRAVALQTGSQFIPVPVASGNEGIQNVLSGHLDSTLAAGPQAPFVRKGDLKVLLSMEQGPLVVGADAPTSNDMGYENADFNIKWMFIAPAGISDSVRAQWDDALKNSMEDPTLREFIEDKLSLQMEFTDADTLLEIVNSGAQNSQALMDMLR